MSETNLQFHFIKEAFDPKEVQKYSDWLLNVAKIENIELGQLNYIFCSDEYLLDLNKKYLDHDFYTDILSFPSNKDPVEGDIFISIDRVRENAASYKSSLKDELHRVMVHGLLHFIGYDDHDEKDIKLMREKEDQYISQIY